MQDLSKLDGWFSGLLGAFLAMIAGLASFFNLKGRVDALHNRTESNDREIQALKNAADSRFAEIRADIHDVSERTERRHDIIEGKIDRLIDKMVKP
jgi:hypothetical protein